MFPVKRGRPGQPVAGGFPVKRPERHSERHPIGPDGDCPIRGVFPVKRRQFGYDP